MCVRACVRVCVVCVCVRSMLGSQALSASRADRDRDRGDRGADRDRGDRGADFACLLLLFVLWCYMYACRYVWIYVCTDVCMVCLKAGMYVCVCKCMYGRIMYVVFVYKCVGMSVFVN